MTVRTDAHEGTSPGDAPRARAADWRGWFLGCLFAIPPALWAVGIFLFSATAGASVTRASDSIGGWSPPAFWFHFGEYAVLGGLTLIVMLIWRAATGRSTSMRLGHVLALASLAIATVYGASDEYHQSFVPGRAAQGVDVLADFLGASTALVALRAIAVARALRLG